MVQGPRSSFNWNAESVIVLVPPAIGRRTIAVVTLDWLLAVFGSSVDVLTDAVFVMEPGGVGNGIVAAILMFTTAAEAIVPRPNEPVHGALTVQSVSGVT